MRHVTRTGIAVTIVLALGALAAASPASAQQQEKGEGHAATTVELSPLNDSGVQGTAVIHAVHHAHGKMKKGEHGEAPREKAGEKMHDHRIEVRLQGLEAGETYPAHVHRGTCSEGGPVFLPLEGVTAGEAGEGSSTTTVPAAKVKEKMKELKKGEGDEKGHPPLFVMAHLPDGTPAACGDIPMKHGEEEGEY